MATKNSLTYFVKVQNVGNFKTTSYKMFTALIKRAKERQMQFISYAKTVG